MTGRSFTEGDLFGAFVLGAVLALVAVAFVLTAWLQDRVDREIDRATTLPAPSSPAVPVDDETARITDSPVHDLPRRGPREWSA